MKLLLWVFVYVAIHSTCKADQSLHNQTYQNQTKIRQLEIDQRMGQIQQDMKSQSEVMLNSTAGSPRAFSPSLPGYGSPARIRSSAINAEQIAAYIQGLGDPEEKTGIYAYPPEERLYRYGLMCIDVGLFEEGVRAITEHLRISAEAGESPD